MPNLIDPKCLDPKYSKELKEEDLDKISGGTPLCPPSSSPTHPGPFQFPYECSICQSGFNTSEELTQHMNNVHVQTQNE